jgi:hypothetical protein
MLEALRCLQCTHAFHLDVVDVDGDPALGTQYDELVPVLLSGTTTVCYHHLDSDAVVKYLSCHATQLESRPVTDEI